MDEDCSRRSLRKKRCGGAYKNYLTSPSPLKSMPRRSLYDKKRRRACSDQNNEGASDSDVVLLSRPTSRAIKISILTNLYNRNNKNCNSWTLDEVGILLAKSIVHPNHAGLTNIVND